MKEYRFDAEKITGELVEWIRAWFDQNGKDCNAILGISGGKDSTICAALCAKALGKDRVIGVLMPNGEQKDISDSQRVCSFLGIRSVTVNIAETINAELNMLSKGLKELQTTVSRQTQINLPPRVRMATLYAIGQSMNGRVINTCNLSENVCGFSTLYGDHAGDVSLFNDLTVTEIRQIGHCLSLPDDLVEKIPSDGLCGKTDEDVFGFSYATLDRMIRTGECDDEETKQAIIKRYQSSRFKLLVLRFPHYSPELPNYFPD